MDKVSEELRPDNCNVVFEKLSKDKILGLYENTPKPIIKGQIAFFKKEGIATIMVDITNKTKQIFRVI